MNLDLDLRESSRGSSILSRPILTIWGDVRSTIPGALARSKFQVADRVGYNSQNCATVFLILALQLFLRSSQARCARKKLQSRVNDIRGSFITTAGKN